MPSAAKEKPQIGEVIAVSDATEEFVPSVQVGDNVLFEKFAGNEVTFEGEKYLILKEKDLAAIVE